MTTDHPHTNAMPPELHMDELDAANAGEAWLLSFAKEHGADAIDTMTGVQLGGARSAWRGRNLLGYYLLLRDPMNWTVLVCHDLVSDKADMTREAVS